MLVVTIFWANVGATANITSVTVGGESAATLVVGSKKEGPGGLAGNYIQMAYHPNLTSSANKTVTVNFDNAAYVIIRVMEYQGQNTASQPDSSTTANNAFTDPSLSLTTTTANALIVASVSDNSAEETAGSGFTLWGTRTNLGAHDEDEDKVDVGAAGAKTVDFVTGAGGTWYMSAVAFKAAGGGGTTPKTFTGTDSLAGGELL
jgi:hypothetical protein